MFFLSCIMNLFLLLLFALIPSAFALCYFPDGTAAAQDTPCTNDGLTTCCGQGYACLSNRICMATGEEIAKSDASLYVRGSCTDKTWNSPNCPLFCATDGIDNTQGGMGIQKCPTTTEDIYFCINSQENLVNCTKKQNVLSFQGSPTTVTIIGFTSTSSIRTTSTPATMSSTPLVTSTPSSAVLLSSAMSSTSTPVTSPPASTAPVPGPTSTSNPKSQSSNALAIGIGVGVGLGTIGFALVTIYLLRRRWKKKALASINAHHPPAYAQQLSIAPPPSQYAAHNSAYKDNQTMTQVHEMDARGERWELQS